MKKETSKAIPADIDALIVEARGQKVILDADLARVYGTPTKFLNRAVKRNSSRFPVDFVFQLSAQEAAALRFHFGTSKAMKGGRRYLPYAFTEHGAIMAANVLHSPRAVQMSVFVVRAFVKMRSAFADSRELRENWPCLRRSLKPASISTKPPSSMLCSA
jgi:ORF6N domain-containing protein